MIVFIFSIVIINFLVNRYMVNVMFQLFGKDGVLEKGGFERNGYIYKDVLVFIVFFGGFGKRLEFLYEVLRVYDILIDVGVIVLVVQFFFSLDDFNWLMNWFQDEIWVGYENYDDLCFLIVCIKFVCCMKIVNFFLGLKFGMI